MTNGNDLVFGDTKGMAGVVALSPLTKREYFAAMAMLHDRTMKVFMEIEHYE